MYYIAFLPSDEKTMYVQEKEKKTNWSYWSDICGYEDNEICIKFISEYEDLSMVSCFIFTNYYDWHKKWYKLILDLKMANRIVYRMSEPEAVMPIHSKNGKDIILSYYHYMMSWNPKLVDNNKVFHIPVLCYSFNMKKGEKAFESKKLLVNISGNKKSFAPNELYSERMRVIKYCEEHFLDDFDLYGYMWDKENLKCYRGICDDKYQVYNQYRFALCLENDVELNYITEKIFDCLVSGIVPIYLGAPNIREYIPETCYICYEQFESIEKMMCYLKNMSKEEYNKYILAAKEWIESSQKDIFTYSEFIACIKRFVNEIEQGDAEFSISKWMIYKGKLYQYILKFIYRLKRIFCC